MEILNKKSVATGIIFESENGEKITISVRKSGFSLGTWIDGKVIKWYKIQNGVIQEDTCKGCKYFTLESHECLATTCTHESLRGKIINLSNYEHIPPFCPGKEYINADL